MWYQGNFPFYSLSTCLLYHSKVPIYIIIIINLLPILIIYHQYAKNSLYLCCMLYLKPHYLTGFASLSPTPISHPQYSPEGGGNPQAIRKKCGLYWKFWTEYLRRNLYIWSISLYLILAWNISFQHFQVDHYLKLIFWAIDHRSSLSLWHFLH